MGEGTKVSENNEKLDWSFIKFDVSINKIFKKYVLRNNVR